jgi:ABC-type branched-subunit amino acid transport system substrate-binding protein
MGGCCKVGLALCAGVLLVAACGSQVPPKDFVDPVYVGQNGNPAAVAGSASGVAPDIGTSSPAGSVANGPGAIGSSNGNPAAGGGVSGRTGGRQPGHSGGGPAGNGVKAASCSGFKNGPGVTNSTITIANVADLSGPVPGLFKSAQQAMTAYVSYFNSTSTICGRKLKLEPLDSQTNESGDQQAATTACGNAFAMVGSMGAFDAGGADTVSNCGIPDLRAATTETARQRSAVVYGADALNSSHIPTTAFDYFKQAGGDAYRHAAFVYLDAGAAALNARSFIAAEKKMGYHFDYVQAINIAGGLIPWDSYATQMASKGIKYVQYIGAATPYAQQLKQAIDLEQRNKSSFHPIFVMDPTAYDNGFTSVGSFIDGTYSYVPSALYLNTGEIAKNPELSTYVQWLQRTSGGAPTYFGVWAWAAAVLFTQAAIQLGGKLTRASLLAAVRGSHRFTANGMVPPQDVGGKNTSTCMSIVQRVAGSWVRKTPYPFTCGQLVNSGT